MSRISGQPRSLERPVSITTNKQGASVLQPDTDRFIAVTRVMAGMWIAFLSLIYINDLPGGTGVVSILVPFIMVFATTPQLPVAKLVMPVAGSIVFASLVYMFLLPAMSSFLTLGPLLFAVTFGICYLYALPQQVLSRAFGLALFLAIAGISNDQVFSFYAMSTTALNFTIVFLIIAISAYIPFSPHPDKVFLRLLKRFFRASTVFISLSALQQDRPLSWYQLARLKFHRHALMTIPAKLNAWSRFINPEAVKTSGAALLPVIANLQTISNRLQEIPGVVATEDRSAELHAIREELQQWHGKLETVLHHLASEPTISDSGLFQQRLEEIMAKLEKRIKASFRNTRNEEYQFLESSRFYDLLGTYRGLSEALVSYAKTTDAIDWSRWKEPRF